MTTVFTPDPTNSNTAPPRPGPGPKPGGPTHPPGRDPLFAPLDSIRLLLRTCQLVADRDLADADPALRMALAERLRLARRAVADLLHTDSALAGLPPAGAVAAATPRAAAVRVGRPPVPGPDTFSLPAQPAVPEFAVGVARPG